MELLAASGECPDEPIPVAIDTSLRLIRPHWNGWRKEISPPPTITSRSTSPSCSIAPRMTRSAATPMSRLNWCPRPPCSWWVARGTAAGDRQCHHQCRQTWRCQRNPAQRSQPADGVQIAVDDNGAGVPEQERLAVFQRFSRGSTASRSGSGLGLALVAQQAELPGGTASLTVSPLGGARLVLQLPGVR